MEMLLLRKKRSGVASLSVIPILMLCSSLVTGVRWPIDNSGGQCFGSKI